jgi:hypothetical protein
MNMYGSLLPRGLFRLQRGFGATAKRRPATVTMPSLLRCSARAHPADALVEGNTARRGTAHADRKPDQYV